MTRASFILVIPARHKLQESLMVVSPHSSHAEQGFGTAGGTGASTAKA